MKNHEWMVEFVEDKLQNLAEKYAWVTHAKVFFKVEKAAVDNNICEIELSLPGPKIFAKANTDSFETAVNKTVAELDKLLKKRKAKMYKH